MPWRGLPRVLFIGFDGCVGFGFQPRRFVEILCDASVTVFENAADARNDDLLHEQVEKAERDREPQDLRCISRLVERRENAGSTVFGAMRYTGFRVRGFRLRLADGRSFRMRFTYGRC